MFSTCMLKKLRVPRDEASECRGICTLVLHYFLYFSQDKNSNAGIKPGLVAVLKMTKMQIIHPILLTHL